MTNKRIELLLEMLDNTPDDTFLNYALALEYAKEERTQEAIKLLEKLIKRSKTYVPSYYQLGKLYEQTGNFENAIEIYKKGMAIAEEQKDFKTIGELEEALMIIEDQD